MTGRDPNLPLVISSGADTDRLGVDKAVVSLGVPVGQVAGLGGEWLLHSSLLQQEAAVVTDNSPGNIRGNHLGFLHFYENMALDYLLFKNLFLCIIAMPSFL